MVYTKFLRFLPLFLCIFLLLPISVFAKTKVAVIGSSSYDAGCNSSFGFIKKLQKALPDNQFDCFTKVGSNASYFLDQYNTHVKGKGYTDIILFGGLNGLDTTNGLNSTQSNLTKIFTSAESESTRVIVTGSQPFKGYFSWKTAWGDNLKKNNAWVATKPHGVDVFIDIYPLVDTNGDDALDSSFDSGDHLHMNGNGHTILFNEVLKHAYSGTPAAAPGAGSGSIPATELSVDEVKKIIRAPQPRIKIPGLQFTQPDDVENLVRKEVGLDGKEGVYISVPFLGEYLGAVYKFAVVAASILAVIFIIIGGFIWTTSAGSFERIDSAKKMIERSLTGLIIAVASYVILFTINPELVQFKNLKVLYIPGETLFQIDKGELPGESSAKPPSFTGYDTLFQSYGKCLEADWHVLKAFASVESGFNASVVNSLGFTGLFQTKEKYCVSTLRKYPEGASGHCTNLKDPEVSTMVGAGMLRSSINRIKKKCPSIDGDSLYYFMYLGHHGGQGTLNYVLGKTCSYTNAYQYICQSWRKDKSPCPDADEPGKRGPVSIAKEGDKGAKKVLALIKAMGVTGGLVPEEKSACPLDTPSLRFKK